MEDPGSKENIINNINATVTPGKLDPCGVSAPPPCALVIFGASGDLTGRKLMPSLFSLFKNGLLSADFLIFGLARSAMDDMIFRENMERAVKEAGNYDEALWKGFAEHLFYKSIDYQDESTYDAAALKLADLEGDFSTGGNRLIYLATPPAIYEDIIENIGRCVLRGAQDGWSRIVIEKPFGRDLKSALALDARLHKYFSEEQIYRIDHYLGKETVQNIVMLRFANAIFEPLWNRRYIDNIQITVAETLGVEKRAGYYEGSGVLRDMFQNHMLQVLALAAMEPPATFASERVRDERVKLLRAIRPFDPDDIETSLVLGQYGAGTIDGKEVRAYRDEPGVSPDSLTPTYAAMKLYIDNWRWNGVPFYLRSGKRMKKRVSEVVIQFKHVPHRMFQGMVDAEIGANVLVLRLQPDERVQLSFHTKSPGSKVCVRNVLMDFSYEEGFEGHSLEAYERVLLDALMGEDMLFVRCDGVARAWEILDPLLDCIDCEDEPPRELNIYPAGSFGPDEADRLLRSENDHWRSPE